jgi:dTDP-4-amino-4,6-dideoxygalactose transaminase
MKIKIGDFKFSTLDKEAIQDVVESNRITEHKQTRNFEKSWAKVIGTKYAIATNSGTSALIAGLNALKHLDNNKRNKVITTPLTYIATSNAIRLSNLEPIYADVNLDTFDIKISGIEKILKNNDDILAILPVHLSGS